MITAKNIHVKAVKTQILRGVDLIARPGELTAIIGQNGCGKTTFLRALTGDIPYDGKVMLNGCDIRGIGVPELAGIRAVLAQSTSLAFPFTVVEVVQMGLMAGIAAADPSLRSSLPGQALARVDLAGYENHFFQELSGGEQQRVHLARVLCQMWEPCVNGRPRWLFLDEPVSSLDIAHQKTVMQIARDFTTRGGGVIAVMHDLNLTATYADQVVLMGHGKVVKSGSVREVYKDEYLSSAYTCKISLATAPVGSIPLLHPGSIVSM